MMGDIHRYSPMGIPWAAVPIPRFGHSFSAPNLTYPFAVVSWTRIPAPPKIPRSQLSIQSFHHFSLLPPELRLRIWSFCAPTGRVLELRSWGPRRSQPIKISVHPYKLPAIFLTCRESRSEALRLYTLVEIGVSFAVRDPHKKYVRWRNHPMHPSFMREFSNAAMPLAIPFKPVKVWVCWELDIIYLGPDFHVRHLREFWGRRGPGLELNGLRRLAIDRKMWLEENVTDPLDRVNVLRECLWGLKERSTLEEVIIVPDDERGALIDRWYYGKHNIELKEPGWTYTFRPMAMEAAKDVVGRLGDWFTHHWKGIEHSHKGKETVLSSKCYNALEVNVPKVSLKSVTRNGRRMTDFKEGVWAIQESMGDLRQWENWDPPKSPI